MKLHQTLVRQRLHSRRIGSQRATTHLALERLLAQSLGQLQQCRILLRCAARQFLKPLIQSLLRTPLLTYRHRALGRHAELILGKLLVGHTARLHLRGQRSTHHLAHRTHIIVGNPLPQTTLRRREQWLGIEYSLDRLGAERRSLRGYLPDDSRIDFSGAKLHHNCLTLTQMLRQLTLGREGERRLRQRQHDMCVNGQNSRFKIQIHSSRFAMRNAGLRIEKAARECPKPLSILMLGEAKRYRLISSKPRP